MIADRTLFTLSEPRFDSTTYWGRFGSLMEASNVRYAFKSNAEVMRQYQIVKKQEAREKAQKEANGSPKVMLTAAEIEELRHAVNITKAAIHPDTLAPIPIPMRMTFFLPGNIPISMGFLFSAPTMYNTILWQVINQTYNALLNFGNANKSSPMTSSDIMRSYVMAVGASCSAGATVRYLTRGITARSKGGQLVILNGIVSTVACAMGGFANNYFIRLPEINKGIQIQDPANGKNVGTSKMCAKEAVWQTATSRIVMALPVGLPGYAFYALERKGLVPKNATLLVVLQLALISTQLNFTVPFSMAAFP